MEARRRLLELAEPAGTEQAGLEGAAGRILAERLTAPRDLPGEDRSAMDGYALRSADTLHACGASPVRLIIRKEILAAGGASDWTPEPGETVPIYTGAALPAGMDAVIAQERAVMDSGFLKLAAPVSAGKNVVRAGDAIRKGRSVGTAGEVLTPGRLAVAAELGWAWLPVFRRPRAAVLATGDEVREVGDCRGGPVNYCGARHLLAFSAARRGAQVVHLGIAPDDPEAIARELESADADLVFSTGGVGGGGRDYVSEAWSRLGLEPLFEGLNLLPGHFSRCAVRDGRIYFGFSGNPLAARMAFRELAVPLLRRIRGDNVESAGTRAILGEGAKGKNGFWRCVTGNLDWNDVAGATIFVPSKRGTGYSWLTDLWGSGSYFLIPPERRELPKGSEVEVKSLD
jgi:molybdopterin molybdotransferase